MCHNNTRSIGNMNSQIMKNPVVTKTSSHFI
jgi:hypothetical protein